MPRRSILPVWGSLSLDRDSNFSLQEQIAAFFRAAIKDGRLRAGMRVRASRQFAVDCGVSRTTAVEAYERLVEEGYLVARPGAGVFIADVLPEAFVLKTRGRTSAAAAPDTGPDVSGIDMRKFELPLAPGMPALDRFPWAAWKAISNRLWRERPLSAIGYGDPRGELALREAIVEYLASSRGIACEPWQIIVVAGTEQVVSFAAGQVAERGSIAWFENPGYPFLRHALQAAGLKAVPVSVDEHGLNVNEALRHAAEASLAVVSPTYQYPLGYSMSLARRMELIAWSRRTQSWILENETDGDYRFSATPVAPIYTLAEGERVVYCGSLSKALAPGLRLNYLVVPSSIARSIVVHSTLVPALTQLTLARLNSEGYLAAHMNRMRRLYANRRVLLLDALRTEAPGVLDIDRVPEAGLRVTAGLRTGVSDVLVASECLRAGICVNPLSACYVAEPRRSGLVIGFASTDEERSGLRCARSLT